MDPVSVTASIVAIATALRKIIRLVDDLNTIVRKGDALSVEMKTFACQVHIFGTTISPAHTIVREHCMGHQQSKVLIHFQKYETLDALAYEVRGVVRRIKGVKPQSSTERSRLKTIWAQALRHARWIRDKKEREDILAWMDRVKMDFMMVMLLVKHEILEQRANEPAGFPEGLYNFRREMREHTRVMKSHIEAMKVLEEQQELINSEEPPSSGLRHVEETLTSLGEQMVEDYMSTASSTRSMRSNSFVSAYDTPNESEDERNNNLSSPPTISTPQYPHRYSPPSSPLSPRALQLPRRPSERRPPPASPIPTSPRAEDPTPIPEPAQPVPNSITETPRAVTPEAGPSELALNHSNYSSVRAISNIIHFEDEAETHLEDGYIRISEKQRVKYVSVTATVCPTLSENIISPALVARLALDVDPHEGTDSALEVNYDAERRGTTQGRVTLRWRNNHGMLEISVTCYICDSAPHELVFGCPFLQKRDYSIRQRISHGEVGGDLGR